MSVGELGAFYLASLQAHARAFCSEVASAAGARFYVDHAPWNLLGGAALAASVPEAVIVLMLRNPVDVVASLGRSYAAGYKWAGETPDRRAALWSEFAEASLGLDQAQVLPLHYDDLWLDPLSGDLSQARPAAKLAASVRAITSPTSRT